MYIYVTSLTKQSSIRGVYTKKERLSFQPAAAVASTTTSAGAAEKQNKFYSTLQRNKHTFLNCLNCYKQLKYKIAQNLSANKKRILARMCAE